MVIEKSTATKVHGFSLYGINGGGGAKVKNFII